MATNIEIRRSDGSNYDEVVHFKTSIGMVDGLLEDGRIRSTLIPSWVFGGLRKVGLFTVFQDSDLTNVASMIATYVNANPGINKNDCYVIIDNPNAYGIAVPDGYTVYGGDDGTIVGDLAARFVNLEHGDWLVCDTEDAKTFAVVNNNYRSANTTSKGITRFATVAESNAGTSEELAMTPKGAAALIETKKYIHPTKTVASDIVTPLTGNKVISDVNVDSYGHISEFKTRDLTLADLGYTGAVDANKYVHNSQNVINIDVGSVVTIDTVKVNSEGHVTEISTQPIRSGSEGITGLMALATSTEAKAATNTSKAASPARVKEMIDRFASIPIVQSLPTDMSDHPAGKLIMLQL